MLSRVGLVGRFAVRSGVFIVGIVIALSVAAFFLMERVHVRMAGLTAQLTANAAVADELETVPLDVPLTGDALTHLRELSQTLAQDGVFAVKLWGEGGQLLYSSTPGDPVGETFAQEEDIAEALEGDLVVETQHEADEETENQFAEVGSLIEVYAPLRVGPAGEVAGVFEMYRSYADVVDDAHRTSLLLIAIIIAGAIPAYFIQLRLVQQAARDLRSAERERLELTESLDVSLHDLEEHLVGTLQALTAAVDAKDSYTASHALNVTRYAVEIGRRLGVDDDELCDLERAGLLHDIGKIGIPESVLLKRTRLTPEEFELVRTHSEVGARIIETIPALSEIRDTILHHHERWDGAGYPDGLRGPQVSLAARILAVADAFDAMTTDRPYRRALRVTAATEELRRCRGTQFDPHCVDALLDLLSDIGPDLALFDVEMPSSRLRCAIEQ